MVTSTLRGKARLPAPRTGHGAFAGPLGARKPKALARCNFPGPGAPPAPNAPPPQSTTKPSNVNWGRYARVPRLALPPIHCPQPLPAYSLLGAARLAPMLAGKWASPFNWPRTRILKNFINHLVFLIVLLKLFVVL